MAAYVPTLVSLGTAPNARDGDPARTWAGKNNTNANAIAAAINHADGSILTGLVDSRGVEIRKSVGTGRYWLDGALAGPAEGFRLTEVGVGDVLTVAPGAAGLLSVGGTRRLRLTGAPVDPLDAATRAYVDAVAIPAVNKSVRVFHNANQALDTVWTLLAFNSERYKTDAGMHSNTVNSSRITITQAGVYLFTVHWVADAGGDFGTRFRLNGTIVIGQRGPTPGPSAALSTVYRCALNDYVEVLGVCTVAGLRVLATAQHSPEFTGTYIAAG